MQELPRDTIYEILGRTLLIDFMTVRATCRSLYQSLNAEDYWRFHLRIIGFKDREAMKWSWLRTKLSEARSQGELKEFDRLIHHTGHDLNHIALSLMPGSNRLLRKLVSNKLYCKFSCDVNYLHLSFDGEDRQYTITLSYTMDRIRRVRVNDKDYLRRERHGSYWSTVKSRLPDSWHDHKLVAILKVIETFM